MIEKIVIDTEKHIFEPTEKIIEKLEYFKKYSEEGLENLSESEWKDLYDEFNNFLNIDLTIFADSYPTKLFRITVNKGCIKTTHTNCKKLLIFSVHLKNAQVLGAPTERVKVFFTLR